MMKSLGHYFALGSLFAASAVVPIQASATGMMTCESGNSNTWKSAEALTELVTSQGWSVRRVKVDGGCYELYGTTPAGERVEAYFHPVTLEKLLVHRRGEVLFKAPAEKSRGG